MLHVFIRMPVVHDCTEQPMIDELLWEYQKHKKSKVYREAVEQSQKRNKSQLKLSDALWWAEHGLEKGETFHFVFVQAACNSTS